MLQSHVINVDGAFVGAAVRLDVGYRLIAIDYRLEDLDGSVWPTLGDLQQSASQLFRTGRMTGLRASSGPGAAGPGIPAPSKAGAAHHRASPRP